MANGKNKYRFNIIDVLLLVLIVLSVCAIVFLFLYNGSNDQAEAKEDTVEIVYTVKQTELPDILREGAGRIKQGDSALLADSKKNMGQVVDVNFPDPVYTYFDSESNALSQAVYLGKINVVIEISAVATKDEDGIYRVNGQILNVGEELDLRFPFYTGKAVCVSISEV